MRALAEDFLTLQFSLLFSLTFPFWAESRTLVIATSRYVSTHVCFASHAVNSLVAFVRNRKVVTRQSQGGSLALCLGGASGAMKVNQIRFYTSVKDAGAS